MEEVSILLQTVFIVITILTVLQFYRATKKSKIFLIVAFIWMTVQLLIGLTGFYTNGFTTPPRFVLLILPPLIFIIAMFFFTTGKKFISSLNTRQLTLLHAIRVPVEIVLYFLFIARAIPQIMTFEGRNFDILAGLTAPVIYYFGFIKNKISNTFLIIWNLICLALLLNIVIIAVLSAATPFQQFGFNQPNIAIAYFPFNWLASVVVPIVLFSHAATLRQLILQKTKLSK
jgi:hypothetical protein